MLKQDTHDVVVVGAGPVGVVAAVAQARQGRRVLLLEANPKAAHRFAGEWLHPAGAEILDQLGIGRVPEAGGRAGHGFLVYPDDGGEPVALEYPEGRVAMSVEHGSFVRGLRQRAADNTGVDYVEGARVTGIDGGQLRYSLGGSERSLRPELIIGADGRGSKVRQWAGLPGDSVVLSHMASVELRGAALPRENFGYVLLGGPGPVLMYRIAEDLIRLCIDVPLAHADRRNPGHLWDAYHPVFPPVLREAFRRGLSEGPVHWAVNRFRPRTHYGAGTTRLVGDAVGHFHPLTAAGMTMGFLDADVLSHTGTQRAYQKEREAGSYVPELLSNALYHVFSRQDASSASIRESVFDVWRKHPSERERTMRILMGAPQGPADFSAAFSRMALAAFGGTVRELTGARRLGELPRTLASYRQWLQWPFASLQPRPSRTRYRANSTPFSAVPLMPKVKLPTTIDTKLTTSPAQGEVPVSTAIERTGEALLAELRLLVERIGHDPDWLVMRRATRSMAAIEGAELGSSMAARLRLGRRALAQGGVARLLEARVADPAQVDARDIASLLVCLYDVHTSEVDAARRVDEALDILLTHQLPSGAFSVAVAGSADLGATQLAARALSAVAIHDERRVPRALRALEKVRRYLRSRARADGSWPAQAGQGAVSATAQALSAMVYAGAAPRSALVVRASAWLLSQQTAEGRFVDAQTRVVEASDVVTAQVLEALCVARAAMPEALEHAAVHVAGVLTSRLVPQLEAGRGGDDWLHACVLLDSLAAFERYRRERLLIKPNSRPAPMGDDWAYCRQSLLAVSRTFSKPIAMLPGDLEIAVSCGYLLCRIADTIEDHPAVPRLVKDELFQQFLSVIEHDASAEPFIEGFLRIEGEDAELDLARNLPRVMRVFGKLPAGMVEAVSRWVAEMARGMNLYTKREPGPDGFTALLTTGDLERYCFFVAGTVGHMLTDLFEVHAGDSLSAEERADLRTYAEGFGMGLQLVNILKDVTDDRERRWSFVPRAVCERAGTSIEDLVDPAHRARAHRAVEPLFDVARARLDDAIAYALTIPKHETGVRLFCLLPLWMAALTLKHARGNDAMFEVGQEVKISREVVQQVIAECAQHVGDDDFLRQRYNAIWTEGGDKKSKARRA